MPRETILYCFDHHGEDEGRWPYRHFCSVPIGPKQRAVWGEPSARALMVEVREPREGESPTYWAWWDSERRAFPSPFVWPSFAQVDICFAYGSRAEAERGRGEVVRVVVEIVGPGDEWAAP